MGKKQGESNVQCSEGAEVRHGEVSRHGDVTLWLCFRQPA